MIKLPTLRKLIVAKIIALILCIPVFANTEWSVESLMVKLSEVDYAKLDFVETKKSIFLITDTVLKGTMEYRAPDYIEKLTQSPFKEHVTIDGDVMTIEKIPNTGKQEAASIVQTYSVESHPILKAAIESIRAMLAGNYETLTDTYHVELTGQLEDWQLVLEPKTDEILEYIDAINLFGSDVQIRKVVTIQPDGDESTLELSYQFVN